MCTKGLRLCDTDRHFKADGIGRYKQACCEGCEVPGATNSSAGFGFCQGHHTICPPLLLTLTEVLTQRGKHPDLQMNAHRVRAGAAGRAHVDKVIQSGVVRPVEHRTEESNPRHKLPNSQMKYLQLLLNVYHSELLLCACLVHIILHGSG